MMINDATRINDSYNQNSQALISKSETESIENILPIEVLNRCFYFLDDKAMHSNILVSTSFNHITIDSSRRKENDGALNFLNFLVKSIDSNVYPKQHEAIVKLLVDQKIVPVEQSPSGFITLKDVKKNILNTKDTIIKILKSFDEKDLNILEDLSKPLEMTKSLENIFYLSKAIFRKIEKVKLIEDASLKVRAYEKIVSELLFYRNFNTAIQFALSFPDEIIQETLLRPISKALIHFSEFDKLISLAPSHKLKVDYCTQIIKKLILERKGNEAYKILKSLLLDDNKAEGMVEQTAKLECVDRVSRWFFRNGDIPKAKKIVKRFHPVSKNIIGEYDRVVFTTNNFRTILKNSTYTDQVQKGVEYLNMVDDLLNRGMWEEALEVCETSSHIKLKNVCLYNIIKPLAKDGQIKRALEIAHTIANPFFNGEALAFISLIYLRLGNIDEAFNVTQLFPKEAVDDQSVRLHTICQLLIMIGDLNKALEIASTIPLENVKANVMNSLQEAKFLSEDFDVANPHALLSN